MDLTMKISFSEKILSAEIDDEMVLLDMKSEKYLGFDEIGASIWQAIQNNNSLTEVYEVLLAEYDVTPEALKSDLVNFVKQLEDRGIITLKPLA